MKISAELSMYPLSKDYKESIVEFVKNLRDVEGIRIQTNGISSQIFGDYDVLMRLLTDKIKPVFEGKDKVVMVIKLVNDNLEGEVKF